MTFCINTYHHWGPFLTNDINENRYKNTVNTTNIHVNIRTWIPEKRQQFLSNFNQQALDNISNILCNEANDVHTRVNATVEGMKNLFLDSVVSIFGCVQTVCKLVHMHGTKLKVIAHYHVLALFIEENIIEQEKHIVYIIVWKINRD